MLPSKRKGTRKLSLASQKGGEQMANNIKLERVRYGWTQQEVAEMIGVSVYSIKNWERDLGSCKVLNLLALSNIFGVTPDYLLGITDRRERRL